MLRVARPTTISTRTLNRLILVCALALVIGIPLFVFVYWADRHVDSGGTIADRTVAAAEAAVQSAPNDTKARNHLAAAYIDAKRVQDGIDQFTQVLSIDATDRAALLGRAVASIKIGVLDSATTDLTAFIKGNSSGEFAKSDPQLEQAYYELGVVQLRQGKAPDAAQTLQKALAIDAGDADALYSLGAALTQAGDAKRAVSALKLAVAFVPSGWCEPYRELGKAYAALRQPEGVTWAGGMVAFCEGGLDEADTALAPLAASGDMRADALLGLALVAGKRGDNDMAIARYREVLAIDPGNQSASIGLSMLGAPQSPAASANASPSASPDAAAQPSSAASPVSQGSN